MPYNGGLNWYGWNNPRSGYGIVSLEYSTALELQLGTVSIGWEREEHMLKEDFEELTNIQKYLIRKPFKKEQVGIIKTTPQLFIKNISDYRIGYSMVENTMIGKEWVRMCDNMDAIFVPCPFLVNVFRDCGVSKPIVSVKQGMDSDKFPYYNRKSQDKFIFATVGYQDPRKNWQDLIVAFSSEFNKNENVELWIKNSNPYFYHTRFKDERIVVINRPYTFLDIQRFYRMVDCLVFPSRGEGSGLPPREAMATGLPVILTNWSGLEEIALPDISYPLTPVAIDVPDFRGEEQPGFMARLDVTELMYWMRHVYEHREEARLKGIKASKYVHENFNWNACATDMLQKLGEL